MPRKSKKDKLEILEGEIFEEPKKAEPEPEPLVEKVEPQVVAVAEVDAPPAKPKRAPRKPKDIVLPQATPEPVVAVDNSNKVKELEQRLKQYEAMLAPKEVKQPKKKKDELDERKQSLAEKKLLIQEKAALLKERELQKKEREIEMKLQKLQEIQPSKPMKINKRLVESESEESSDEVKLANLKKDLTKPKEKKIVEQKVVGSSNSVGLTPNQLLAMGGF
jgi:hypothetical protein